MKRTTILLALALFAFLLTSATYAAAADVSELDYDNDGQVTDADYEILTAAFGSAEGDDDWNPALDLNGDGKVTGADITTHIQLNSH